MALTIKDHIDAGHYPKDEKGRALVPMEMGTTAVIYATDHGGACCIIGRDPAHHIRAWHAGGLNQGERPGDTLLPPPPRKVKVTGWAHRSPEGRWLDYTLSKADTACWIRDRGWSVVELTGEYEEPWS